MRLLLISLAWLGLFGLTISHYRAQYRVQAAEDVRRQLDSLTMQAVNFGKADTLVIGDSIMQRTAVDCGRTFNMAVSGATSQQVIPFALRAIATTKPDVIIVGLGSNDTEPTDLSIFAPWRDRIIWVESPRYAKGIGPNIYRYRGKTSDGVHPDESGRSAMSQKITEMCAAKIKTHNL